MKLFSPRRAFAASVAVIALSLAAAAAPARAEDLSSAGADADDRAVGVVSHLNLVSDKSQDLSTLEAWKKTYIKPEMSDQEKAIAVFNTMTRYRQQASPPSEYLRSGMAGGHVDDPMKTVHVYGYGQCCGGSGGNGGPARYRGLQ